MSKVVNNFDELFVEIAKDFDAIVRGVSSEASDRMIIKAPKESGALAASIHAGVNSEPIEFDKANTDYGSTAAMNRTIIMGAKAGDQVNIIVGAPYGQIEEIGGPNRPPVGYVAGTGNEIDAINVKVNTELESYRK